MKRKWRRPDGKYGFSYAIYDASSGITLRQPIFNNRYNALSTTNRSHRAIGTVGGISILSGVALGSAAVLTGGSAIAVGGLLFGMYARGKYSSKQYVGTRMMLEGRVREVLEILENDAGARWEARSTILKDTRVDREESEVKESEKIKEIGKLLDSEMWKGTKVEPDWKPKKRKDNVPLLA